MPTDSRSSTRRCAARPASAARGRPGAAPVRRRPRVAAGAGRGGRALQPGAAAARPSLANARRQADPDRAGPGAACRWSSSTAGSSPRASTRPRELAALARASRGGRHGRTPQVAPDVVDAGCVLRRRLLLLTRSACSSLLDRPTRYLFFTGKGGVGKTSLACATAVALAEPAGGCCSSAPTRPRTSTRCSASRSAPPRRRCPACPALSR